MIGATIHEEIFASRVTVNITVEQDITRFKRLAHHHFGGAVLGALLHAGRDPLSIEIVTAQ